MLGVPLNQAKAELFRTLGHPARIRILELLCEGEHAVHELLAEIDIEASNLSQQLAVLRRALLVVSRRDDGQVTYAIAVPEVRILLQAARGTLAAVLAGQRHLESALADSLIADSLPSSAASAEPVRSGPAASGKASS